MCTDNDGVKKATDTTLETIQNYILSVSDMVSRDKVDWEKVYIYFECMSDEIDDIRGEIWHILDEEFMEDELDGN